MRSLETQTYWNLVFTVVKVTMERLAWCARDSTVLNPLNAPVCVIPTKSDHDFLQLCNH